MTDIVTRLHTAAEQTRTAYHPSVADSLAAIYTDAADRIEALIAAGLAVADRWDADDVSAELMDYDIGRLRAAIGRAS